MGNLLLNFVLTAALYMLYPIFTVLSKKGKEKYTQAELRNTAIINAVIVKITIMFLTYPNAGSVSPAFFWGYISYKMMMKYLLQTELPEPEPPVQEHEQQPEPIPATPEKVKVRPVKVTKPKPEAVIPAQPEPATSAAPEPKKQDSLKSFCIIAAFFAVFFFVVYVSFGNQNNSQPEKYYITTESGNSYTEEEIIALFEEYEIKLLYAKDSNIRHFFSGCELLNSFDSEIYEIPYAQRKLVNPALTIRCPECFTDERIELYLTMIENLQ